MKITIKSLAVLAATTFAAQAASIISPTGGSADVAPFNGSFADTFNSAGLVTALNNGATIPVSLPQHNNNVSQVRWVTTLPTQIDITLGGAYDLQSIIFYNYAEDILTGGAAGVYHDRGIATADLSVSTDGGTTFTAVGNQAFAIAAPANPGDPYDGETISFTQNGVTDVRFTNLTTHGSPNIIGFAEIRFTGDAVVPEPTSSALLGLGALSLLARRRR